jgi:hypothetical protein
MNDPSSNLISCNFIGCIQLRAVLIVPFVLQIFGAVGLTGYLSFRNGQQAINNLAQQLQKEGSSRLEQHLNSYLTLPHQINQINKGAVNQGLIDLKDIKSSGRYFWKQSQVFKQFSFIGYALADNTGAGAGRWLAGHDVIISQHPSRTLKDFTYAADTQGNPTKLLREDEYDAKISVSKFQYSKPHKFSLMKTASL